MKVFHGKRTDDIEFFGTVTDIIGANDGNVFYPYDYGPNPSIFPILNAPKELNVPDLLCHLRDNKYNNESCG